MEYTIDKRPGYGEHVTVTIPDGLLSSGAATQKGEAVKAALASGAYLRGAYLTGADLTGAYLRGADLRGAYLTGADLRGADLRGAYLTGADLTGAYLTGAYLRGADLRGADLTGAYLRGEATVASPFLPTATRSDGYEFRLFTMSDGEQIIRAGCRTFNLAEYEAHIVGTYDGSAKAVETRMIIAFLVAQAAHIAGL